MRKIGLVGFLLIITFPATAQFIYQYDQNIEVINTENDTLKMAWAGGLNAPQFNTMDLDGDQDEDLVIFERSSNNFKTFENIGQSYEYNPAFESLFPSDLDGWVILKDYNCDGKKDIFTNTIFGIKVYKNIGEDTPAWELVADPIYTIGLSGNDINLQVNGTDIPGIADIDNDGDLDILVYNFSIGGTIRYHKNLSMETEGNCENLKFERESSTWGEFEECICDYFAFEGKTCDDVVNGRLQHAGGKSMLLIDVDADNDKDLIMSQEDCNKLYFLENKGDKDEALMTDFSMQFPTDKPAHFNLFPAAFYEDVTFDGVPDLLVAPNLGSSINNDVNYVESSWIYENKGLANNVDFHFVSNEFLQEEMIDAGENAQVAFIDLDDDNDLDMLIAGNYSLQDGRYYGSIKHFENTGNNILPSYKLTNNNFLNFSARKLIDLQISIVNMDETKEPEIIIHGSVPFSFDTKAFVINRSNQINEIEVPTSPGDNILFYDVNGDGQIDMLVGKATGNIQYYKNSGNNTSPAFSLENNQFAGIPENFLKREIYPAVADIDNSGVADLVTIDNSDTIFVYKDFFNEQLTTDDIEVIKVQSVNSSDNAVVPVLGTGNSLTIANITGQVFPSLIIGTRSGGVLLLKSNDQKRIAEPLQLDIYPNPATHENNRVNIRSSADGVVDVVSVMGKYVFRNLTVKAQQDLSLDTRLLADGLYIIRLRSSNQVASKRLLVWNQ